MEHKTHYRFTRKGNPKDTCRLTPDETVETILGMDFNSLGWSNYAIPCLFHNHIGDDDPPCTFVKKSDNYYNVKCFKCGEIFYSQRI